MPGVKWLRPEYEDREDELETREEFFKRTGVSTQSLSSHFNRYGDKVPAVVKLFGKKKWFVASELDTFIDWIKKHGGTRSEADIKRAEMVRLEASMEEARERIEKHEIALGKAKSDLARHQRSHKRAKDDLEFLEQGS